MGNITIKDIAKAVGNSVSTVSKALNNSVEIGNETKEKIVEYARLNNYKVNRLASSLKKGRSNTIGVIVCSINNTFISQLLDGIQKASLLTGFDVIIMQSHENVEIERSCLEALLSRGVDGILIAPVFESSNEAYLASIINNCPVVLYDRINSKLNTSKVGANEYNGAYKATQQLIKINRKSIVFITGDKFGDNNQRYKGFKEALNKHDITFIPDFLITCNLEDIEALDEKIKKSIIKLRKAKLKPDAIFGATDIITTRTIGILAELKIKVPDEMAVIGFSNTDIAFAFNPPLSTIRQPATDMGFMAFTKVADMINSDETHRYKTLLLNTTMQLRASTKISKSLVAK